LIIRVVDTNGTPVAGAVVVVTRSSVPFPEIGYRTDAAGEVRLAMPPGQYVFDARTADGMAGEVTVTVEAGRTTEGKETVVVKPSAR
jgi:hypothetical protein